MRRIVPNMYSDDLEVSKAFYMEFLEMDLAMDLGWIITFASKENPTAQINIFKNEEAIKPDNTSVFLSIEISNVDQMYERAKRLGYEVVYGPTNEEWGVRRFFVKDPNGATINLLTHL
ncbi:Glyoxalase/bleomycin resistance protein/dioxygenase [Allomuricauda ruestringensis DSM 13258]|uniref:Glyoxalase/bleomycin resistance protein/dioxygenase n=1 Tax=Allomuricauda ruestringensis (strain DSM 13258 / CIP 107369 / LMG 19739 / B1) TaxID=886377 RepID=G2PLV1_ALLRU|nr:VOC family protein [Allomuricauda ruestringensis]AEM72220.1 Glyoxalase/bleomycin resistance protein/dioxygenase [Allomuricauda ruestringensis DSM 13258]